jgi:hypothetical protein
MRHDRLLRAVAIGLSLAVLPSAHAGKQVASQKRVAGKSDASKQIKAQKIVPAKKADVVAARNTLQMKIELADLVRQAKAVDLGLLGDHHSSLNPSGSLAPIAQKGELVVGLQNGELHAKEGGGYARRASVADLEKVGIAGKEDFERVVSERVAELARGVKGVEGKDAREILQKDMERTKALKNAISYGNAFYRARNYIDYVMRPTGALGADEHVVLADGGAKGSLVITSNGVRWKEKDVTWPRDVQRADLEGVGIKTADDFNRLVTARLFQLMRIKGDPNNAEAVSRAEGIYDRERAEVTKLGQLLYAPHSHADLALVARSRVSLQGPQAPAVVLAKNEAGDVLQFAAQPERYSATPIYLKTARGGWSTATVADLYRFKIDSTKAFDAAVSQVLTNESK